MPDTPPVVTMSFGSGAFPFVVVVAAAAVPTMLFIPAPSGCDTVGNETEAWSACVMGKERDEGEMKTLA
jgi:hypothetical protein